MTRSRLVGVAAMLTAAVLAAGCISYHRGGAHATTYASHDAYIYGSSFHLGGGHYRVLYHPRSRSHYFRTRRFGYHGRHCGPYCYRHDGYHYHHAGCAHLRRHVRNLGFSVGLLIERYGPPLP